MALRIWLLGGVELERDGVRLPAMESGRVESLLAYLLLHRNAPQSRRQLASLLWPDTSDSQALTNLRHVLHWLRRALPDSDCFLDVSARTLQWRADAPWELDVAAFESALARAGGADSDASLEPLREAVELYRGDLVPGCYDEWLLAEREGLRQRYLGALRRLVGLLDARGESLEVISYAERLLRADPLDEETCRLLMRLHDARGDRARAVLVYHAFSSTLEEELGTQPSAATRRAYDALLASEEEDEQYGRGQARGRSPLVGRTTERSRLTALWRATEGGLGQFVLISGEAGIGKTRLVGDFRAWCAHRGAVTAEARSYAAEGALAYGPVATWLRSPALRGRLARLDRERLTELARLLPELLVEVPGLTRPEPLPEGDQRHALFDAVAHALLSTGRPLLLIADDLHWFDRETLQLLHYLVRVASQAPLLVVGTARREDVDLESPLHELVRGLHALERLTEMELVRLPRAETAVLAERLTGAPLDKAAVHRLWRETEGNPLFVVETVRAGLRSDGDVSPRVNAVIESRLAQLSAPASELVGVAASIGRDFTADLLAQAADLDDASFVRALDELWRRRLVREQGGAAYDFSHDRIRAVAYDNLGPVRRRSHHLRIARALECGAGEGAGEAGAQIAAHYERGGAADDAVSWYVRAVEAAQRLHANAEAVRLLDRARDVLLTRPRGRERDERELGILTALPAPLVAVEGYASPRLSAVQNRALELADALGTRPAPPLLRSLAFGSLTTGDFARAERFAEQLQASGERDGDDVLVVEGRTLLGLAAFWQAQFDSARRHFEAALARYRPERRDRHLISYGQDPAVVSLARLGNTLWFLGEPAAALRAREDALALSGQVRHPFSRAAALVFAALLALDMGDDLAVREYAAELAASSQQASSIRLNADALAGYVDVLDGRTSAGLARVRRSLDDATRQPPAPGIQAMIGRVLMAACAAAGDPRAGLDAAERYLAMGGAAVTWEAEARRLRAAFSASLTRQNA